MKVSVVVATYRPQHLDRVLASLDAQTMPAGEHELVLADDGSGEEHVAGLREVAGRRPHTRVLELEHTGWPGHPRNAGLAAARGEYVLFMDHDDELYPEALAAAYAYAREHHADVLAGKETRTDQPKWALEVYRRNVPDAARADHLVHPLLPTNPHKLYRRAFLLDHGIRFPEGRRVLWEDVFFNIDVAAHRPRVAVLSDVPFYHWVRGGRTASSSYGEDLEEFWTWVERIFAHTDARLGTADPDQHARMRWHQFRHRMMPNLGSGFFAAPPRRRAAAQEIVARILDRHVPPDVDADLPVRLRARAHLARAGEWDLLAELCALDVELTGTSAVDDVTWQGDGTLRVAATARWTVRGGRPLPLLLTDDGRVELDLPDYLRDVLPAELRDVTADVRAATSTLAVRSRATGVTWLLPTTAEVSVRVADDDATRAEVSVRAVATLDRDTAALGRPLPDPVWDLSARNELFGVVNQRGLRTARPAAVALADGETRVAYRNGQGVLAVDLGQSTRSLVGSAGLRPERATTRRRLGRDEFEIPFGDLTAVGRTDLDGGVVLQPLETQPATIAADGASGAVLRGRVSARPGRYRMLARFGGRAVDTKVVVTVSRAGRVRFEGG